LRSAYEEAIHGKDRMAAARAGCLGNALERRRSSSLRRPVRSHVQAWRALGAQPRRRAPVSSLRSVGF